MSFSSEHDMLDDILKKDMIDDMMMIHLQRCAREMEKMWNCWKAKMWSDLKDEDDLERAKHSYENEE